MCGCLRGWLAGWLIGRSVCLCGGLRRGACEAAGQVEAGRLKMADAHRQRAGLDPPHPIRGVRLKENRKEPNHFNILTRGPLVGNTHVLGDPYVHHMAMNVNWGPVGGHFRWRCCPPTTLDFTSLKGNQDGMQTGFVFARLHLQPISFEPG